MQAFALVEGCCKCLKYCLTVAGRGSELLCFFAWIRADGSIDECDVAISTASLKRRLALSTIDNN